MSAVDLPGTVDGAGVEAFGLVNGVLDLEAGFDVFDGGGDKGDGPAGHDACECVAKGGEFCGCLLGGEFELANSVRGEGEDGGVREEVLVQDAAVEGEGAEHSIHGVVRVLWDCGRLK